MIDALIEQWAGGVVTSPGPGELLVRTPGGDLVKIRAETVTDVEAMLHARWAAPAELAADEAALHDLAQAVMMIRSPLLRCEATAGAVDVAIPLYLDRISRQDFLNAVAEVGHTHWVLTASAAELLAQRAILEGTRLRSGEVAEILEQVQSAQRDLEDLAADPAEASATSAPVGWVATHTVPDGGMPTWVDPDPSAVPVSIIAAGVEVQVCEQRANWAHVVGANGANGWVDGRRLVPR